jgi:ubiquinol-cytochrome c reductase iron-sulfur subunit
MQAASFTSAPCTAQRCAGTQASKVPDISAYQVSSPSTNRAVIGSMGILSTFVAKYSVAEFLATMSVSADVLVLAKVEVELFSIPEGKNAIIMWCSKPIIICRTR